LNCLQRHTRGRRAPSTLIFGKTKACKKHATQTSTLCEAGRLIPENKLKTLFSHCCGNLVAYQTTRLLQKKCASAPNKSQSCKHFFFAKGVFLKFDGGKEIIELVIQNGTEHQQTNQSMK
jgi:hypothetical protein